jgi:AraC-like DNA-binding protein
VHLVEEETFARLYRFREFLANSFGQRLRWSEAARQACLSPVHYHRMFRRAFGGTPHDFLTRRRIDRAKQILELIEGIEVEIVHRATPYAPQIAGLTSAPPKR